MNTKIAAFVAGATAVMVSLWTVLAFVRFGMIMTIAGGFAGAPVSDRLVADAWMSLLFGGLGAAVLLSAAVVCLVHRARHLRKERPPVHFAAPAYGELHSV